MGSRYAAILRQSTAGFAQWQQGACCQSQTHEAEQVEYEWTDRQGILSFRASGGRLSVSIESALFSRQRLLKREALKDFLKKCTYALGLYARVNS